MKFVKHIWKIALFVALMCLAILPMQQVLQIKTGHRGTDNIKGFYEIPSNSIDVLFVGASTMFCTADPLKLYEDYGITSFDFCSSVQPVELSRLCVEEAFKTQNPKVVVFETTMMPRELDENNLSYGINDIPLSKTKIMALHSMFRDEPEKIVKYLFPIMQFKDRWEEIGKDDFTGKPESFKRYAMGAFTPSLISDDPIDFSGYEGEAEALVDKNVQSLVAIKTMCEANGAKLLLLKSPSVGWSSGDTKQMQELADELQLEFLEMYSLMDQLEIDPSKDFRDNSHLNRTGSAKASGYLGDYLVSNYDLTDHRDDAASSIWRENIRYRDRDYSNEALAQIDNIADYFNALEFDGYTIAVQTSGDLGDNAGFIDSFAANLGVTGSEQGNLSMTGGSFIVTDGISLNGSRPIIPGDKNYTWENFPDNIVLNGYSITYNKEVENKVDEGIILLVYDNEMKQLVDIVGFDTYGGGHATR